MKFKLHLAPRAAKVKVIQLLGKFLDVPLIKAKLILESGELTVLDGKRTDAEVSQICEAVRMYGCEMWEVESPAYVPTKKFEPPLGIMVRGQMLQTMLDYLKQVKAIEGEHHLEAVKELLNRALHEQPQHILPVGWQAEG